MYEPLADEVVQPFHNPEFRDLIVTLKRSTDQIIDDSADETTFAGYDEEKAKNILSSFKQFIADNQAEISAIQLIYSKSYKTRHLSYDQIEKLAEKIEQPPYNLAPIEVWKAYSRLETAKVKGAPPERLLTNIISLVTYASGLNQILEPFPEIVERRFQEWVKQQDAMGTIFNEDQIQLLSLIKAQIAQNAEMTLSDFDYTPFNQQGGLLKAKELFGQNLDEIITELNGYLIA